MSRVLIRSPHLTGNRPVRASRVVRVFPLVLPAARRLPWVEVGVGLFGLTVLVELLIGLVVIA